MNPLFKDIFREIRKTAGRFISITLLLTLAVGFYSGLRATQPDMQLTADKYMDDRDMFDLRVQSTLGLSEADLEAVRALPGVERAEGGYAIDAIIRAPDSDIIISLQTITPGGLNTPELLEGELPKTATECLVERRFLHKMELQIGDSFPIIRVAEAMEDALATMEFTITGIVRTPLYMSTVQRGVSTLDTGRISEYVLIPREAVALDYYLEINATVSGAKQAETYADAYVAIVDPVILAAESLGDTRLPLRYEELTADGRRELQDAEREVSDKSDELEDARRELADGRVEYKEGVAKLEDARREAEQKIADAKSELDDAERQIRDGRTQLSDAERELEERLAIGASELDRSKAELDVGAEALAAGWEQYNAALELMPETELTAMLAELEARQAALDAGYAAYQQGLESYDAEAAAYRNQLASERKRLDDAAVTVRDGRAELEAEREKAEQELSDAETELADALQKLEDGERELADGEVKLADARREIEDGWREINDVPKGAWYVFGRDSNYGYANFGQDADRMGALGAIFPIIFFAVAALVCLTTMTRMVDEQRIEIGTLKSLGVRRFAVAGKFIVYGGLAAVIGVTAGLALGMNLLPRFIFRAYSVLYDLPTLVTPFHYDTVSISVASSAACTLGVTALACAAALRETPASLLRPRAPTPGKRVFLEYITPLWRRMSFYGKVSARNVLRYKKRLIMTITGIAGCTALIVTGLGLRDSIIDLPRMQFQELYKYDLLVTVDRDADTEQVGELRDTLGASPITERWGLVRSVSAKFSSGAQGYAGDLLVPEQPEDFCEIITLRQMTEGPAIPLTDGGAVISAKLAELLELREGDTLTIEADGRHEAVVAAVTEHYVNHVVYMTPVYYERVMGEAYKPNQALIICTDDEEETATALSAELLRLDAVGHAVYFKNEVTGFTRSIGSIDSVVTIIVTAAGALAFVVLFNLTNINITERRRELATIKVLGFYDGEVTWYIIRENMFLTLAAIAVGLVGGKYLHNWLVRSVEVDFTMFKRAVAWPSYVFAALLTIVCAVIVNFVGHLRMRRINMVESLKINE